MKKTLHILSVFIILLGIIVSCFGLFYKTCGQSFDFINQYGDVVKIYGDGIYKNDSYFMAPIFRGTDCMILFLAIPLLIIALIRNIKKDTIKTNLFLTAIIAMFAYYSASISLGVVYNMLYLVYITLFSCSIYAFIVGFMLLKKITIEPSVEIFTKGLKVFMVFCGLSTFVAWLPDIIASLMNNRSLELIEVYTTQVTYVLDMAIISPLIFICLYNRSYILLGIILNMLAIVGVMVIFQTVFQAMAGIDLPIEAAITKVGMFVVLAVVAVYYEVKLFKNI